MIIELLNYWIKLNPYSVSPARNSIPVNYLFNKWFERKHAIGG